MALSIADVLLPVDAKKQSSFAKYTGILASMPSFLLWLTRHKAGPTEKVCMEFLNKLRCETPPERKIGMAGFCWGGRYAIRAALEENMMEVDGVKKPLVDAVVAMHPSNMVIPLDVEKLVVPVSIGWGVEDQGVSFAQKGQVEDVHAKATKSGRKLPEIEHQVYRPGRHGFGVRGNPDDPQERKAMEDSEAQALAWFDKWL